MDIRAMSNSRVQLQSSSVTADSAKMTAHILQQNGQAPSDTLQALDHLIDALESNRSVEMHYDKDIGRVVIQVVDEQTQKVVFQIPSEGIVNTMKSFRNYLKAIREGV